jgi:hypothetical protein
MCAQADDLCAHRANAAVQSWPGVLASAASALPMNFAA